MSTETWLQSLIKLYTRKQGQPSRPAPAPAQNYARPVYAPAPRPTYGPPTQAQARAQGYMPDLPFALPRFEADPASRAPTTPVLRVPEGPLRRTYSVKVPDQPAPPVYRAKVYGPAEEGPVPLRNPLASLPNVPAPIGNAITNVGTHQWEPADFLPVPPGWGQPSEAAKEAYRPTREKWEAERAADYERIYGQPYDSRVPKLKTVNPIVKKLITTLPNGEALVTTYEDIIQFPQRWQQAERNPTVGDIFRGLHYGTNAALSYAGQFQQAFTGQALGTLEGEAMRDPAFRQELANNPVGPLLSPSALKAKMSPILGLSALMALKTGNEEVLPILYGLQDDPIVPTTGSLQGSVEQAIPTYLNRYTPAEQFGTEIVSGFWADPLMLFGMGKQAAQLAKMRRFMSVYMPGMQDMVGSMSLLDRFTMATARGINEGKVPVLGWIMRETPKTQVYLRAQDAMTYGGWLSQMLPSNPSADDVIRVFNGFVSRPDDLTGGAKAARDLVKTLGDDFDIATLNTVQEAIENGTPVNMPKLVGELADTAFLREADKIGALTKDKKTGDMVFAEPFDQRMVRWLKDIESAFLLGTPAYPIRNMANNVFTAAFDGYGVGRGLDDARRLAAEVPIANQGVFQDVMGVPVSGANTFTEYLQGKGMRLSEKLPWSRAARHVASDGVIGERQARVRVYGDVVGKAKEELYINGPDLGRGATGLRPVIAPDVAGPHAGLVNQVLARDWNIEKARKEIAAVLKGGVRPPIDTLLPQRLYLRPEMVDALNTAWKNARTKDDFMKVLDRADNIVRQQIGDAAASGAHADITQVGDSLAPVADQMAATIVPGVPETRQIAEQVARAEQGRVDNVLQTVAQAIGQSGDPASAEKAINGVAAIMTRLEYQWSSSYIEANRLLNRYNGVRQNIFERGLKGEDKTRALTTAWNNYQSAITQHWTNHHEQADRLVQGLLNQYNDLVAGKLPAGSLDQRAAERAIAHLQRNTPELLADPAFKAKVEGNRQRLGLERVAVVQRVMGYVARTGDTTPVGWLADAISEERRLTDVAVGEITGMRTTLRKTPEWGDIGGELWDALNTDQRSVWRAFLVALDESEKTGKLIKPRFNEYTQLFRLVEANDRIAALNKLAKGAGIATDDGKGAPAYQHLANFLNKAFRDAGLTDDVMFQAPSSGITRAWREYVMDLDEQQLAIALRALNGREALTPLERMIGQTKAVAAKQYIRQYADWLQGDQRLAPPTRGKLTEAQAKAWRKKVDDLLGAPEAPAPTAAPSPIIAEAPPTTVGVSPEAPPPAPTIAPALQAARDSNVAIAEQLGVKDEILARAAEGQDAGQIARDLRAEGALPESYDFTPGEMAAQVEPVTMTDRAVVKSVVEAEASKVAPAQMVRNLVQTLGINPPEAKLIENINRAMGYSIKILDDLTPAQADAIVKKVGEQQELIRGTFDRLDSALGKAAKMEDIFKAQALEGKAPKVAPVEAPAPTVAAPKAAEFEFADNLEAQAPTGTKWQQAKQEADDLLQELEDGIIFGKERRTFPENYDAEVTRIIDETAAKYQVPASTLRRQLVWEQRVRPHLETLDELAVKMGGTVKDHGDDFYTVTLPDEQTITAPGNVVRRWFDNLTRPGIAAPGTAETQALIAKLLGKPRPSATHVARNEAEGQLWELGELRKNADRMWNTSVMPASREAAQATMKWFDQVAVPRIAAAKTVVGHVAQATMDEIMLDYGRTRNLDRILDLGFPYHYWTTRSGWNWAKRTMHHPATIGTYIKSRQDRVDERKSDNGLRPRFWNSMKAQFPWLPDWMENELWFNPENLIIPFSDFTLPDWDNVEEANSAWYKANMVAEGLNLMPHVPMRAIAQHSEGLGWGGLRDYIPQWNAGAAVAGPSKYTWGPGVGGSAQHAYLTTRMIASMAADALHLPNVDYDDPRDVLRAAQEAGIADMTPLMPYLEATMTVEAWKQGQLTDEQIDALFQDPLIGEAIRRAALEKAIPTISGFMTGLPVRGRATGETLQVQLQNAKRDMGYGGEVAGEQGLRENVQAISGAFPWERVRWAQYGALPGDQEFTADNVYWMTYKDAGMQDIEQRFDAMEEALIQQNPGNHEMFLAYQTERFAAIDGLEQTLPKDEQKPYLWSIVGASPTEAAQIRQNQIVYRIYATRPKPNEYLLANGKPDWDKWNKAVETWNQTLLDTAKADPLITEALAHFSPNEREKVLSSLATAKNMEAYGRGFDDPLTALHKTVWDIYYQPVRDYMAAAEAKYGTDIFDRQAAYRAELNERFGDNIYDVQDGYFKLRQGSAARRNYLKANPQLKAYWDNKDAIARKHRVLAFLQNKDKLWAKIPQTFKGGQARDFIDEVQAAYPEKKWTREELLAVYNTVKPFPDRYYLQALNDFEEERLQAFYAAAGVSPNRAREGAWTPEEIKAAVFAGQALPLDTIPEQLAEGMGTPETPEIQQEANDILAAEERAKAGGGKGKSSGGRSSGRRYYSRRYYSRGGGGGGGGGSAPTYRPYLPGYTPGATKERRRVYIR